MAVHRFKANESSADDEVVEEKAKAVKNTATPSAKQTVKAKAADKRVKPTRKTPMIFAPFVAFGNYFVGSWQELRRVHWPNRKQTWALTLAVIIFSLALGLLIFLLDAGFTLLFKKFIF